MTAFSVQQADQSHIPELARIHVKSWQAGYKGFIDQQYLDSLSIEKYCEDWKGWMDAGESTTFLALADSVPVGFIVVGKLKTPPPGTSKIRPLYSSEIYAIYILEEYWRQGVGKILMKHGIEFLKSEGHKSTCLWVLDKNKRAQGFYEFLGGQRIGKMNTTVGPNNVRELCYGWRDLTPILEV